VATQPTLGAGDAGYILWLTDYKHTLRWTGATWEFFGGNGNDYVQDCPHVPQTGLWQLCDGTATKYLTLGASLTETTFTVPDLISTPAYRKSIAAYTGTINAKSGSTGTGTTGTGVTGTDVTGDESSHTHGAGSLGTSIPFGGGQASAGATAGFTASTTPISPAFTGNTGAGSAHHHTVPALSVPSLSVPSLSIGTIEMAFIGMLPYYRR
jgi:hypothetical protein